MDECAFRDVRVCSAVLWLHLPSPLAQLQVITQKVVRKQDCISAVDRSHPAYTSFAGMPGGRAGGGASTSGRGGGAGSSKVQIEYCYKAPSSLRPVFGEAGLKEKERLYNEEEVCTALAAYAAAQGLAAPDGRSVRVDHLLQGALFNKKEGQEGAAVPVADLRRRLLGKLQLHHRILRQGEQVGRQACLSGTAVASAGPLPHLVCCFVPPACLPACHSGAAVKQMPVCRLPTCCLPVPAGSGGGVAQGASQADHHQRGAALWQEHHK
jgi:hypothetical protein